MTKSTPLTTDYLLIGGMLVTMNSGREVIENGAVAIRGSEIVWIGRADQAGDEVESKNRVDARGGIIIPGLINAHSHLAMTLFRGLVDDQPLEAWLGRIWQVESEYATAQNTLVGTQLALVEMIRGGVTCSADMYWQYATNIQAAKQAGFRLVNGPPMIEIVGPGGILTGNLEERAREFINRNLGDPLLQLCIQVHSTYTTTEEMLAVAAKLSAEYNILFITHASESRSEVETVTNRFGKTPIEYLHSRGLLGPRTLLAHCVHLRDDEIALLHETGTSVAHCPESNLKVGNGVARVPAMLKAGVNVALGTDGAATNNDLDMFGEMRTAALLHKGVNADPTVVSAEEAFAMATINGARAFGLSDRIGSIEVGKLADIAIVDLSAANVTPMYNVYSHLCYAVDKNDVRTVFINGKLVMDDRKLLTLDEEEIKTKLREIARAVAAGVDM
jgi:5-methylthioadenosine/S-adenosylhomocysteine deaminase